MRGVSGTSFLKRTCHRTTSFSSSRGAAPPALRTSPISPEGTSTMNVWPVVNPLTGSRDMWTPSMVTTHPALRCSVTPFLRSFTFSTTSNLSPEGHSLLGRILDVTRGALFASLIIGDAFLFCRKLKARTLALNSTSPLTCGQRFTTTDTWAFQSPWWATPQELPSPPYTRKQVSTCLSVKAFKHSPHLPMTLIPEYERLKLSSWVSKEGSQSFSSTATVPLRFSKVSVVATATRN